LTGAGKITAGTPANCCPDSVSAVLAIPNIDLHSRPEGPQNDQVEVIMLSKRATMRTDNIPMLISRYIT
jgi:hypothetical protein